MSQKKLVYFVAEDYYFCSHRLPIALAAQAAGYQVSVICRTNQHAAMICQYGFDLYPIKINRSSLSLVENLRLCWTVRKILAQIEPDILHNVAIKPIVFGTLACLTLKAKTHIINAFAGLGYVFSSKTTKAKLLKFILQGIYKVLFAHRRVLPLFQNQDDARYFQEKILRSNTPALVIRGSGVDVSYYKPTTVQQSATVRVLMAARLLKDKGIFEYLECIRQITDIKPKADIHFMLAGAPDNINPTSLSTAELEALVADNLVEYLGELGDMREGFAKADIVVLPSYREGLPKVLLEAAACQKAIITTNVPGCRELIQNQQNGLLVPAKSAAALRDAILLLAKQPELRQQLAAKARQDVVAHFSDQVVSQQTLALYASILSDDMLDLQKTAKILQFSNDC